MTRLSVPALALLALWCAAPAWAGDAASGERLFRVQCAACHSSQPGRNQVGPSLAGVYGRRFGAAPGYRSSAAGHYTGVVWD